MDNNQNNGRVPLNDVDQFSHDSRQDITQRGIPSVSPGFHPYYPSGSHPSGPSLAYPNSMQQPRFPPADYQYNPYNPPSMPFSGTDSTQALALPRGPPNGNAMVYPNQYSRHSDAHANMMNAPTWPVMNYPPLSDYNTSLFRGNDSLEDRVRSMILSESRNTNTYDNINAPSYYANLASEGSPRPLGITGLEGSNPDTINTHRGQSKPKETLGKNAPVPRKRLNQAQRRQQSREDIPTDPRTNRSQTDVQQRQPLGRGHQSSYLSSPGAPPESIESTFSASHQQYQQQHNGSWQQRDVKSLGRPMSHQRGGSGQAESISTGRMGPSFGSMHRPKQQPSAHQFSPRMSQDHSLSPESVKSQVEALEILAYKEIAVVEPEDAELEEKEALRSSLEEQCRQAISEFEKNLGQNELVGKQTVELLCYGSISSGFATKSSDMDLALLSPSSKPLPSCHESPIPRMLEGKLLDAGYGARLLTKTRVPIMKFCQRPTPKLLDALRKQRQRWEEEQAQISKSQAAVDLEARDLANTNKLKESTGLNGESSAITARQRETESVTNYYHRFKQRSKTQLEIFERQSLGKLSELDQVAHADLCISFIRGLHNPELRERVMALSALDRSRLISKPCSLRAVWIQVEAESLLAAWECRKAPEFDNVQEMEGQSAFDNWVKLQAQLQAREVVSVDPAEKLLFDAWRWLQKFPSIQLEIMSQRHDEQDTSYAHRASTVFQQLGVTDLDSQNPSILGEKESLLLERLIDKFTQGIKDGEIRENILQFRSRGSVSFQNINAQFLCESAIRYYQKAASTGQYTDEEQAIIASYASAVREYGAVSRDAVITARRAAWQKLAAPTVPHSRSDAKLDFPKTGVGIQCDINFSSHLALHNTQLLRCYSLCDTRVRPMVLFVKTWARKRNINSPYYGTLSSYGYVLMVIHYLMNIVQPPILPNLQHAWSPTQQSPTEVDGHDVRFWRDERSILELANQGQLMTPRNEEKLGSLLRGFFHYYSEHGRHVPGGGFGWKVDVISIRTTSGLLSKQEKGWTGAKTTITDAEGGEGRKEVRHRYLMAIEDPFEIEHNVARTVFHHGIVAIRDEFRRAWNTIRRCNQSNTTLDLAGLCESAVQEK